MEQMAAWNRATADLQQNMVFTGVKKKCSLLKDTEITGQTDMVPNLTHGFINVANPDLIIALNESNSLGRGARQ